MISSICCLFPFSAFVPPKPVTRAVVFMPLCVCFFSVIGVARTNQLALFSWLYKHELLPSAVLFGEEWWSDSNDASQPASIIWKISPGPSESNSSNGIRKASSKHRASERASKQENKQTNQQSPVCHFQINPPQLANSVLLYNCWQSRHLIWW